jgi:uncharacterized protein
MDDPSWREKSVTGGPTGRPAGTLTQIWRYPISSVGGETLEDAELTPTGVAGDREWCLLDPETGEVAAPEKRKRWRPAPHLQARTGDGPELRLAAGTWLPALAPEAALAMERHFGFRVELRRAAAGSGSSAPDSVKPRYEREPIHLLTTASLERLSSLLPGSAMDPRRFRPNLVIDTTPGGEEGSFVEQSWMGREWSLGTARLRVVRACTRCAFTVIAQPELGLDPAILAAITKAGDGAFGVLCSVVQPGRVRVGDRLVELASQGVVVRRS